MWPKPFHYKFSCYCFMLTWLSHFKLTFTVFFLTFFRKRDDSGRTLRQSLSSLEEDDGKSWWCWWCPPRVRMRMYFTSFFQKTRKLMHIQLVRLAFPYSKNVTSLLCNTYYYDYYTTIYHHHLRLFTALLWSTRKEKASKLLIMNVKNVSWRNSSE